MKTTEKPRRTYAALVDWGNHFPGAHGWYEVIAGLSLAEAEEVCREALRLGARGASTQKASVARHLAEVVIRTQVSTSQPPPFSP